jgi:hypothetical protein
VAARTTLTRHTSRGLGASAWAWAYEHLLPSSSTTTVYNLWRYRQHPDPDPQRNATAATIDYAVQKNAFVLDHQTHLDTGGGPGMASCSQDLEAHPQADCSPGGISPWLNASEDACHRIGCCWHAHGLQPTGHMCVHPSYNSTTGCCAGPDLSEDHFVASVLATMEPLFSAYGWSYEYSWTNLTSIAGKILRYVPWKAMPCHVLCACIRCIRMIAAASACV